MTTQNPHDQFLKSILSDPEEAISFLESTLPKEIVSLLEISKLEMIKETFISEDLKESRTDILWKIPTKSKTEVYAYTLFEHKSYYDKKIYHQLLKYLSQIYEWHSKTTEKLAIVIPFVFYHGEKSWDLGKEFKNQFQLAEETKHLEKYIPNFQIELFELEKADVEQIFAKLTLQIYLELIQKWNIRFELMEGLIEKLSKKTGKIQDKRKRVELFFRWLRYLYSTRKEVELRDKKYYKTIEVDYMTILDQIQEEAKLDDARKMVQEGISVPVILRVTGLSEETLKEHGII